MFCTACGAQRADSHAICLSCGAIAPPRSPEADDLDLPTVPKQASPETVQPPATLVQPAAATRPPPPPAQASTAGTPPPPPSWAARERWRPGWLLGAAAVATGLLFVGIVAPIFSGSQALVEDLGSSWPFLLVAAVGLVATIDLGRGHPGGFGAAAGPVLVLSSFLYIWSDLFLDNGFVDPSLGYVALALAVGCSAMLLLGLGRAPGPAQVQAPVGAGLALGVGALLWAVAVTVPDPNSGVSLSDNLFPPGGLFRPLPPLILVSTGATYVLAAIRRTPATLGLAAGGALSWLGFWAAPTANGGGIALGIAPLDGPWIAVGALGVAAAATIGLLTVRPVTNWAPRSGAHPGHQQQGPGLPISLLGTMGLAAVVGIGIFGLMNQPDGPGTGNLVFQYGSSPADTSLDGHYSDTSGSYQDEGGYPDDVASEDDVYYEDFDPNDGGVTTGASCPREENTPSLERYWRDDSGIHLVIVISTSCANDQVIDDPDAKFGVYAAGEPFAEGTFSFATSPVALPAFGSTSEIELLFNDNATLNSKALSHVDLPSRSSPGVSGIDIRYLFRCTPTETDEGRSGPLLLPARGGADLSMDSDRELIYPGNDQDSLPSLGSASGDDALAQLRRIAYADQPFIEAALFDRWVPQLSSKQIGTFDATTGITYDDYGLILDEYLRLKAQYPEARLLNSSTYSSFKLDDYWIVIQADTYATPEDANAWCDRQGIVPTDCYAKRINNGDYEGNTRSRE